MQYKCTEYQILDIFGGKSKSLFNDLEQWLAVTGDNKVDTF